MSSRRRIALAWLPAAAYTLLIWVLSSQQLTVPNTLWVPMRDRGIHFVEYLGLAVCIAHAVRSTWPGRGFRATLAAVWITACLGFGDELHQLLVIGRTADFTDWIADLAGTLIGASGYALIRRAEPPAPAEGDASSAPS